MTDRLRQLGFAACLLALPLAAAAQSAPDENAPDQNTVVVTATRTATPLSQVASSVTVITAQQLAATHQPFVLDALREVPGVYISQTGGPGGITSLFLRGADAGDTLVLIDGVPVNDPSSTDGSYDFGSLTVDNIERIEILRGPQSTLYGSDAMAGVVNIITKKGHGKPKTTVTLDGGRYRTAEGTIASAGSDKNWDYSATASQFYTLGYPQAADQPNDPFNDGYRNTTLSARADDRLSGDFTLGLTGRYVKGVEGITDFPVNNAVDYGSSDSTEQKTVRLEGRWDTLPGKWGNIFGISANTINRDYYDLFNYDTYAASSTPIFSNYNGKTYQADWQSNYAVDLKNLVTVGAVRQQDEADYSDAGDTLAERNELSTGVYAQDQITLAPRWLATVGGRTDQYESFGTAATYRLTSSYELPDRTTRFKATYGTGFKAPTLYELFDPLYGNSTLHPEHSSSYDLGVEQSYLKGRGAASATYFHSDYENLIDFEENGSANGQYVNVANAEAHGVELVNSYKASSALRFDLNYTYTQSEGVDGAPLPRRPGNVYGTTVNYQATHKLDFHLNGVYVGHRYDTGVYPAVTLGTYYLFNLGATYHIAPAYSAFARIDNLFNEDYEEVATYRTPGRGLYGGVTFGF